MNKAWWCVVTILALAPQANGADWPMARADAASWCTCSYLNQATCALEPTGVKP